MRSSQFRRTCVLITAEWRRGRGGRLCFINPSGSFSLPSSTQRFALVRRSALRAPAVGKAARPVSAKSPLGRRRAQRWVLTSLSRCDLSDGSSPAALTDKRYQFPRTRVRKNASCDLLQEIIVVMQQKEIKLKHVF